MKSNLLFFILALVLGLFAGSSLYAQSNPPAVFSSDSGIMLSKDHPLVSTYDIDISSQEWTREAADSALNYFKNQTGLIDLRLDYGNKKFILTLQLDSPETKNWDLKKWNEHLAQIR